MKAALSVLLLSTFSSCGRPSIQELHSGSAEFDLSGCQEACLDSLEGELAERFGMKVSCTDLWWEDAKTCASCTALVGQRYGVNIAQIDDFCADYFPEE